MIVIDASQGEGGGQVLRTALSLSAVTRQAVTLEAIRGTRKKPGLMRQHLTCVRAAAEICGAAVEGAELGSQTLVFKPGEIRAGNYNFAIGTAGSTVLVAQTVLPILAQAEGASTVTITGGTHVKWAPTAEFFAETFLPQFRAMGGEATVSTKAYGFYPAGGGQINLRVAPWETMAALNLMERGGSHGLSAEAMLAHISPSIGLRELKILTQRLSLDDSEAVLSPVDSPGPGNALTARVRNDSGTYVFTQLGERGVKAETVASHLATQVRTYLKGTACADEHLADQLLLPMALCAVKGVAGQFTTSDISLHFRTNVDIIRAFLRVEVDLVQTDRKSWTVTVRGSG